jgi:hypothetical protein
MWLPRFGGPKARLRRFPYPYRAALALSNDAEFLTPRAFWDIHRFLNTEEPTPLGPGLGLQITDSVFMYSVDAARSFSYFDGTGDRRSRHVGWMRELMQEGILDVLHAYGDFDGVGGFTRSHAERALAELERHRIRLHAWTNHGTVENTQNLGTDRAYYQLGDLPGEAEYHADLTTAYGIRFCWLDFNATNVFGNDGLGRDESEALLAPGLLRDGNGVYLFQRYRGPDRPDPSSLASQLSEANLARLREQEAIAIVYQHLGCDRSTGSCVPATPPYISPAAVEALRRVAELHHTGEVLVAGVASLLRYVVARDGLRWRTRRAGDGSVRIEIDGVEDPVLGTLWPEPEELAGITFVTRDAERAEIWLGDRPLEVARADGTVSIGLGRWELPPTPHARFL